MTLLHFPHPSTATRDISPIDDFYAGLGEALGSVEPEQQCIDDFRRYDVQGMELLLREVTICGEKYAELVIDENDDPVGHALDAEAALALAQTLLAWAGPQLPERSVDGARCGGGTIDGPRTRAQIAEAHASLALFGLERMPCLTDDE